MIAQPRASRTRRGCVWLTWRRRQKRQGDQCGAYLDDGWITVAETQKPCPAVTTRTY